MKIKHKLTLGVGLLFLMILVLSVVGASSIHILRKDTENILTANYNSLEYARRMLTDLDQIPGNQKAIIRFERHLSRQRTNVTESGEREATNALTSHFGQLTHSLTDADHNRIRSAIRKDISTLMHLNMEAIQRKHLLANETAATSMLWIVLTGTGCFLIAFTLLVNLPGSIAGPIKELTESIKAIAAQNYHRRVHFESHNEFGDLARSFNSMARQLEQYNNSSLYRLLLENKRTETLMNNLSDPVIGLDENRVILFANHEACHILGLEENALKGQPALEIALHNDLMRNLLQHPEESASAPKEEPLKIYAHHKESYFRKELIPIRIMPTGEQQYRDIGHFIILRNITEFKERDTAKTHFIATVSHELKTPLSSIKLSLQLLENTQIGTLNPEQTELVHNIREDSDRLLRITGELLDLSQVETGNIRLNTSSCPASDIVQVAVEAVKTPLEQQRIQLQIILPEPGLSILADPDKTVWVLLNFLTNAIRYTPESGKILLEVKSDSDQTVRFAVSDQGPGIATRYQDKIFDRYFRIPEHNHTGTGLGLSISKEFIEAQKGRIGVESTPDSGSTFFFNLPAVH